MSEVTLITGCNGLVGSAIGRLFPEESNIFIGRLDADLRNRDDVYNIIKKYRPKRIVNLAAEVGGVNSNAMYPASYFANNMAINMNLFECAVKFKVEKIMSYMSTCVFPNDITYPITPEKLHDGAPHSSNFGYAYAKRMVEILSRAYQKQYGINSIVLVPTNIYGPNDNFDTENGHVLPSLINKMYRAKLAGEPFTVWGSGKPLREFVYSDDIARLSMWALDNYNEPEPLILSSEVETSIRDTVNLLKNTMGFNGEVIYDQTKPDGQFRKPSSGKKLNSLCPNYRWVSLDAGIKMTVNWFMENFNLARGVK